MVDEELEEGEKNPVQYEDSPYFNCALNGMHRLCFSTADDPFYKTSVAKYYPECVVLDSAGKVLAKVNPQNRKDNDFHMSYMDDFRDQALRINDDKKI